MVHNYQGMYVFFIRSSSDTWSYAYYGQPTHQWVGKVLKTDPRKRPRSWMIGPGALTKTTEHLRNDFRGRRRQIGPDEVHTHFETVPQIRAIQRLENINGLKNLGPSLLCHFGQLSNNLHIFYQREGVEDEKYVHTLALSLKVTSAMRSSSYQVVKSCSSRTSTTFPQCSPFCIVAIIVLRACFTTSNTLSPVLSAGAPVVGSAGIGASVPIEPDTSITQHMSIGGRFPSLPCGLSGGVTETKSCLASGSAERTRESEESNSGATAVVEDVKELTVSVLEMGSLICIGLMLGVAATQIIRLRCPLYKQYSRSRPPSGNRG